MKQDTDLKHTCLSGGERCDLHFVVENEILQTKTRVNNMTDQYATSFDLLNKTLNDFIIEMRLYVGKQEYKEESHKDMKNLTLENTSDINDLKSSLKSVEDHNKNVMVSIDKMDKGIQSLSDNISRMDKSMLDKDGVKDIVNNAIVQDKNTGQDKWFGSLPAKISAAAAVLTFVTYFTVKIVVMLIAL